MSASDQMSDAASETQREKTPKKRGSGYSLQLRLQFPHLSAIILILFTMPLFAELSFITLVAGIPFGLQQLCLDNNLPTIPGTASILVSGFQNFFVYLAFPVAGWLADAKYGRYKVINTSITLMWLSLLIMVLSLLLPLPNPGLILKYQSQCTQPYATNVLFPLTTTLLCVSLFLFSLGVAGFLPNILPFLIDQLSEASNSWVSSYVRWFAWAQFVGYFAGFFPFAVIYSTETSPPPFVVLVLIMFALHTVVVVANVFCREHFIQCQAYENPCKTLVGVLNFARKNRAPIKRSAMTYCENKLPGRLDLAKVKYGGPFTHESVENVKTFFQILLVFLGLAGYYFAYSGPLFNLPTFLMHFNSPSHLLSAWQLIVLFNYPIIPILGIPLIEFIVHWLWPKFEYYLHKPFIWIALGYVTLMICNGSLTIIAGLQLHANTSETSCFLNWPEEKALNLPYSTLLVEVPSFFFGISDGLVYTSVLYFISCQAPSSMRGMLLGLFLVAHRGFASMANLISLLFMAPIDYPLNCGVWYWLTLTVVGSVSIPIFILVAKRYKKRERQEIVDYRGMIESVIVRDIQHDEDVERQLAMLPEGWRLSDEDTVGVPGTSSPLSVTINEGSRYFSCQ